TEELRWYNDRSLGSFFFSSRRRHTRFKCDWSSDVCSCDLDRLRGYVLVPAGQPVVQPVVVASAQPAVAPEPEYVMAERGPRRWQGRKSVGKGTGGGARVDGPSRRGKV